MDNFDEFGDAIDQTRRAVAPLEPPSEAAGWHEDYIDYLASTSVWANDIVTAYYSLDFDTLQNLLLRFDAIVAEEDQLAEEFETIQRELGAR